MRKVINTIIILYNFSTGYISDNLQLKYVQYNYIIIKTTKVLSLKSMEKQEQSTDTATGQ